MNSQRAYDMTSDLMQQTKNVNTETTKVITALTNFFNYLQVVLYVVVGIIIFVVPVFASGFSSSVLTATTTALFLAGSLAGIISSIPHISQADVAAKSLRNLANNLEQASEPEFSDPPGRFDEVQKIALHEIIFTHTKAEQYGKFTLGPINYVFNRAKVYFIRGNNGSGKTTLMRILIGLSQPQSGQIFVDDAPLSLPASSQYRDIFAVVFSDFFLFKKLYGLSISNPDETAHLLELFKMTDKVSITDGEFSDVHLSTGQRKRLALIVALLEKRQFLVLDEWAADQDPEFRREFYQEIIPAIKSMGKTVIAITHDDQYYEVADHVLQMSEGKLLQSEPS
jgi:putative ATP-binding cassette transporter